MFRHGIPLVFSRLPGLSDILPQPLLQHEERASACQHSSYTELCHQDIQIQLRTTGGSWGSYQLGPRMPPGLASEYHKGTLSVSGVTIESCTSRYVACFPVIEEGKWRP